MINLMSKGRDKKGFTLAELLIVVAIIAVLVAVSIPIFTSRLEKSREATDVANMRAAYASAVSAYLGGEFDSDSAGFPITRWYDANAGQLVNSKPTAYGKGTGAEGSSDVAVAGTTYDAGLPYTGKAVKTVIAVDGTVTVTWE